MKKVIIIYTVFLLSSLHVCAEEDTVHVNNHDKERRFYYWDHLDTDCTVCGNGGTQSPINISNCYKADLENLKFSYRETSLKTINNGHTIKVEYERGSSVEIGREVFTLLEFHFHHPSEHKVRGKFYDMEIHFVHRSETRGILSVVSVLISEGKHNNTIEKIWNNFFEGIDGKNQPVPATICAEDLLPDNRSFYYYYGSVTTPPCSEGVNWYIFKTPIEMSKPQINKFETVIGFNARPLQPLNYRLVFESQ
ncbi:MAG: carbonic anhydrase family protein [Candidatus Scalindua sp.]|nr:carbonic anhydrase family protein [Candidatus Scalindua sp.]